MADNEGTGAEGASEGGDGGGDALEVAIGGRGAIAEASRKAMQALAEGGGDSWAPPQGKAAVKDAPKKDDKKDTKPEAGKKDVPTKVDDDQDDEPEVGADEEEGDEAGEEGEEAADDGEGAESKGGEGEDGEGEEEKKDGEDAERTILTLRGLKDRGEEDEELDITDLPKPMQDRLRRLEKEGMNGALYNARKAELEQRESAMEEIALQAETNPAGFALEVVPKQHRLTVAKALLVEHWDELQPTLQQFFEEPTAVPKAQAETARAAREGDRATAERRERVEYARSLKNAIEEMVPEGTAHEIHAEFLRDAQSDLLLAIREGKTVRPSDVAKLLERRARLYGFAAPPQDRSGTARAVARPVSDRAQAIAARGKEKSDARSAQDRLKQVQTRRKNASAIAPGGRGTAAARKPVVPKGASIEETTRALRKAGAGASWDSLTSKSG